MPGTAVVTGATSGIGAAFARALAAEGSDLVLVARDARRLSELAGELRDRYGVAADVLPADLTDLTGPDGCAAVEARLADPDLPPVDLLVNNAGKGLKGSFWRTPVREQEDMLNLNCTSVLRLTHAALRTMVPRDRGGVITVSSVAGLTPGSRGAYSATKAWATVFTEALATELAGTNVSASVVAPGFVHTEFHQRAGMDMRRVPDLLWLDADDVAAAALRGHRRGKVLTVPGLQYQALVLAAKLAPRGATRFVGGLLRRKVW
ncbi:MAG TPA: SDR family oxidoreductase [Mycobacteriales bacterium]